jgi:hypothetical protein
MSRLEVDRLCSVTNANFDRIVSVVGKYLGESRVNGCTCEKCINSIIATALNALPTHYYVDKAWEHAVGSPWILVENAVAEAVERRQECACRIIARIEG